VDKFIILYRKNLHGAVVGTEAGEVKTITKQQRHNRQWLDQHTSDRLKVFKLSDSDLITNDSGSYQFIEAEAVQNESLIRPQNYIVSTDHFDIVFNGYFSAKNNTWIIEENPAMTPHR
jgi:hypothetical protein